MLHLSWLFVVQLAHLKKGHNLFKCDASQLMLLEQKCLVGMQAPPDMVKAHPFTLSSQTTAYDWVQFVRSYGKYFLSQYYSGEALIVLVQLLDLMKLVLCGNITADVQEALHAARLVVAQDFSRLPRTELGIVFHNLIFHLPDTIGRWGPVRGYWCFPFERSVRLVRCCMDQCRLQ